MKYLTAIFLLVAVLSATLGAVKGIAPEIVLSTKITLVASLLLFLVTLVMSLAQEGGKMRRAH